MTFHNAEMMDNFEIKLGKYTFKGIYIAIFLPLISSIGGGVWYVSDFYNRIDTIQSMASSNSSHSGLINNLDDRLASVEQSINDNDISSLQGKLAELGTNLSLIMEAQKELMNLKDSFKDIEVTSKENDLLVKSYELRIKELEEQIDVLQKDMDSAWRAMDALANPLG